MLNCSLLMKDTQRQSIRGIKRLALLGCIELYRFFQITFKKWKKYDFFFCEIIL